MLIADGIADLEGATINGENHNIRLFDISPGEMYFRSLSDYFKKPREELPIRNGHEYGKFLTGIAVKFAREKEVAESHLGRQAVVIRNGVPILNPSRSTREEPKGPKLIFGTAARISPDKRLEDLIEAFAIAQTALPPYELHIAGRIEKGADEYAEALRKQGDAAGIPIVWRGELPNTQEFLPELNIFVMISEPAGCPNGSLEAMAAELPVIATDVGGAHEQVIDGITGRLTPRRDVAALASAILEVAHDPIAQTRYGIAGRQRIQKEFSMHQMVEKYKKLCQIG